jgi:hypothetical protein
MTFLKKYGLHLAIGCVVVALGIGAISGWWVRHTHREIRIQWTIYTLDDAVFQGSVDQSFWHDLCLSTMEDKGHRRTFTCTLLVPKDKRELVFNARMDGYFQGFRTTTWALYMNKGGHPTPGFYGDLNASIDGVEQELFITSNNRGGYNFSLWLSEEENRIEHLRLGIN